MTEEKAPLVPIRAVCAGIVRLVGGKLGELWLPEDVARDCRTGDDLRSKASPFSIDKARPVVGAVYEVPCLVEDGKITSIGLRRRYLEMLDTPATQAAALAARGLLDQEASKKAEEKAKRSIAGAEAITDLARIVAAGRIDDQELIIRALTNAIRKEALDIWRAGRK